MATADETALSTHLTQLRHANPTAFMEQLFEAYYASLGAVIYRVVPDRAVMEDLLQDVFLEVWQSLDKLPSIISYRAYLTRAALNAALRYRQRRQRQVAWEQAPPAAKVLVAPDALADLHAAETATAVAGALALLPPQCRLIFELSRYEEMTYQQIADALDLSPKTVDHQMVKALKIMRRELTGVLKNLYLALWLMPLALGMHPAVRFCAWSGSQPPILSGPGMGVRAPAGIYAVSTTIRRNSYGTQLL